MFQTDISKVSCNFLLIPINSANADTDSYFDIALNVTSRHLNKSGLENVCENLFLR